MRKRGGKEKEGGEKKKRKGEKKKGKRKKGKEKREKKKGKRKKGKEQKGKKKKKKNETSIRSSYPPKSQNLFQNTMLQNPTASFSSTSNIPSLIFKHQNPPPLPIPYPNKLSCPQTFIFSIHLTRFSLILSSSLLNPTLRPFLPPSFSNQASILSRQPFNVRIIGIFPPSSSAA